MGEKATYIRGYLAFKPLNIIKNYLITFSSDIFQWTDFQLQIPPSREHENFSFSIFTLEVHIIPNKNKK